ncbi:carboxypeptidase regulatory-like domain-containing protein [Halanaerobacter jeridensis]|uniref:Surface anchored protein n=1 Tax=Halanaerobacter jeridensis TaxID=706427 RepID=A0A938XPN4_9FIRM|nr:carboxypeptidase regulatory-like domain-containing protein [Halanaerobacter jeridensis]MBM7557293.1 putative surface anchored protein [Halanaerobacter jeridensis]
MNNLFSNNSFVVARHSFIILIALSLLITGCSKEPETTTSNLTATVIDNATGKPLANCIVSLKDEMTQTDQNGLFTIKDLQAGNYQINVTKLDSEILYEEHQAAITINNNQDSKVNIKLKRMTQMNTQSFWDSNRSNSGSFEVKSSNRTGPNNNFALLYPSNLEQGPYPVITWGNGTGAIPEFYWGLLKNLASHGFIVIASRSTNTGSGAEMIEGVNWLLEENNNPTSKFHATIDSNNISAAGHSQGGGGALNAGANSKIKTTILIEPGLFGGSTR